MEGQGSFTIKKTAAYPKNQEKKENFPYQGSHRPGKVLEFDLGPGKLLEFQRSAICPGICPEIL